MKTPRFLYMAAGLVLGGVAYALAQSFSGIPSANQIFAGPSSGSPAPAAFRSLVVADFNSGTNASATTFWNGAGAWKTVKVNHQVFLASGTYTPSAGLLAAIAEGCGGAGAGGGVTGAASRYVGGGGGGAGSPSRVALTPAQIGSSQPVTIGAGGTGVSAAAGGNGGDTSLGSLLVGKGGTGGGANDGTSVFGSGGVGGVAGTGDATSVGNAGGDGSTSISGFAIGGYPGAGLYGGAPALATSGLGTKAGIAAAANSCSGGSAAASANTASNAAGGTGGSGRLIVTEYIAQ